MESEVFSLIGSKRYNGRWKDIEAQGYIAPADCAEVRVTLPDAERLAYAMAEPEERYRLASTTSYKNRVVEHLVNLHPEDHILVIGQYYLLIRSLLGMDNRVGISCAFPSV